MHCGSFHQLCGGVCVCGFVCVIFLICHKLSKKVFRAALPPGAVTQGPSLGDVNPSIRAFHHPYLHLPVCPSIIRSCIIPSTYPFIYPSIHPSIPTCIPPSIHPKSIHPSIHLIFHHPFINRTGTETLIAGTTFIHSYDNPPTIYSLSPTCHLSFKLKAVAAVTVISIRY